MAGRFFTFASLAIAALAAPATPAPETVSPEAKVCPPAKKFIEPYSNAALPNPFLFDDGTPVTTRAEWDCRRKQMRAHLLAYELGDLPGKPPRLSHKFIPNANASLASTLTIMAGKGDANIAWNVTIKYPAPGVGKAPYPAVLVYDGLSIPVPSNVAVITVPISSIGVQNTAASRGQGLFYNLYGRNATGSAMIAWTWAISRVIDVLENDKKININTGKLAVTGCSRNGKGALVAGALEERITLTIAQESGSGGDTCWRLSKYEQDSGDVVQQATEIVGENVWFSLEFANWVYNISSLPFDHHFLMGLVAPRALYTTSNTDFEWLSPLSAYGCSDAALRIYNALGVGAATTLQQDGGHNHCTFPPDQVPSLNAYYNKYLLDQPNVNTSYGLVTNHVWNGTTYDASRWIPWSTPYLN